MKDLKTYSDLANTLGREGFVERCAGIYLLRKPLARRNQAGQDKGEAKPGFHTRVATIDNLKLDFLAEDPEKAVSWQVIEVKKREGKAFPDKLSVGRVASCDICLPYPSVSKLHGYMLLENGRLAWLVDDGSTNGTWLGGTQLEKSVPKALKLGDAVRFGGVDLQLVDAGALYRHVALEKTPA